MKIFGIAGYSGSGKTTLIERVLPLLGRKGMAVAVIKHTHHGFDIDRPGKDSWRVREAGAAVVLLVSDHRSALLIEHHAAPPRLEAQLDRLPACDLALVEGYKHEAIPKLEVHRAATGHPWLFPGDPNILAVASDVEPPGGFPRVDLDAIQQLTDFILAHALSRPTP
ncbi:MAG TPA: molybdopterin-guanine dinucleotide biosynthesis protein B [Thiobacillaceae bacterium]|nr:molybdopterin-guanine dinucleotide biosynthesis protein B [Thiobacillaceae bacterium]